VTQKEKWRDKVVSNTNLDPSKDLLVAEVVPWAQSHRQQEVSSSWMWNSCWRKCFYNHSLKREGGGNEPEEGIGSPQSKGNGNYGGW